MALLIPARKKEDILLIAIAPIEIQKKPESSNEVKVQIKMNKLDGL